MWPFKEKDPKPPFDGLPDWDISPETRGRWNLRKRQYMPMLGMTGGFYYMLTIGIYATKEEVEIDAMHLKLPPPTGGEK